MPVPLPNGDVWVSNEELAEWKRYANSPEGKAADAARMAQAEVEYNARLTLGKGATGKDETPWQYEQRKKYEAMAQQPIVPGTKLI